MCACGWRDRVFVFVYLRLLVGCLLPIGYVVGYDLFWCDCLFVVLLLRLLVGCFDVVVCV